MRRLTWCGPSGTTRSAAPDSLAARSASTARAKGPASSRRSSRRPSVFVFEARTRTRSCPAHAVGVMSSQTRGGDLGAAQPRAERQRHDRGVAPPAGRGGGGRLPPPAAALGPPGRPHQVGAPSRSRARRSGAPPPRGPRRAGARCRAACLRPRGVFVGSARPAERAAAAIAAAEACTVDSLRASARSAR